jgi:multidrug efflux pump
VAEGAGAEMRRSLGTAVFSGMLGVTMFGIFFTPVFFLVIERLSQTRTLSNPLVKRIGSMIWSAAGGIAVAFLLHRGQFLGWQGAVIVGAVAAVATGALAARLSMKKRIRPT